MKWHHWLLLALAIAMCAFFFGCATIQPKHIQADVWAMDQLPADMCETLPPRIRSFGVHRKKNCPTDDCEFFIQYCNAAINNYSALHKDSLKNLVQAATEIKK